MKTMKLSEIGDIVGGATPSTQNANYYGGLIPWITPKDLSNYAERYILRGERSITEAGLASASLVLMPPNSVLFSSRAPIGYVAITANQLCTNQGFKSIVPYEDKIDYMYLYYLMKYKAKEIESLGSGTTFKEVSGKVLKNFKVKIHDHLPEQRAIAATLSCLDDKIELNNRINKNLEEMAQAIFIDFVASNFGTSVKLQTLCKFQEGYVNPSQSRPEYFDGAVKWLRAVDINESFIFDTSRTLTDAGYESAGKSALLFKPNTIAISKSGTIGRLGIVADYMCGNRAVINIAPHDDCLLPFVYLYLKSRQSEFPDLAVGSVQKNLYVPILQKLDVDFPPIENVLKFCDSVRPLFEQRKNNVAEGRTLTAIRNALLPKLMSGEIRLNMEGLQ